ncbi:MAG: hypothetical protein J0M37_12780 [Ignavibacteria bacterium]|nr:hypothetical protein [Ignavibacteria bacterium]
MVWVWGCGDDSTTGGNNTGGSVPTINMKVGSAYSFTNDSLDTNGTVRRTQIKTTMVYAEQNTFFGQSNAFKIRTTSIDTFPTPTIIDVDSFYVRYDGGKFYQYGMVKLIDSTQSPNWDLVADFNVATGTEWNVTTINTTINGIGVTANIKGKVAGQTSFNTTSNPSTSINAYKVEITAYLTALSLPIGNIVLEYYIGYADPASNPSGLVRLKLNPIKLSLSGTPFYGAAGVDQVMQTYFIP